MVKTIIIHKIDDIKIRMSRICVKGAILFDEKTPTKNIFLGIFTLECGGKLDIHYHDYEEMQHVIKGYGVLCNTKNKEGKLCPGQLSIAMLNPGVPMKSET